MPRAFPIELNVKVFGPPASASFSAYGLRYFVPLAFDLPSGTGSDLSTQEWGLLSMFFLDDNISGLFPNGALLKLTIAER